MNPRLVLLSLAIFLGSIGILASASEPIKFKDGDKICFIGNSITHGGISGDNAGGMLRRFDEDVLIHNPNYAFVMTGMNDVNRSLYRLGEADSLTLALRQQAMDTYYRQTDELARRMIENKIQPIFMTPTIYDQTVVMELDAKKKLLWICASNITGCRTSSGCCT